MPNSLLLEFSGPIARLTFNRPHRRNAVNFAVMEQLELAVTRLEHHADLRCVIVTGAGDDAFVSGGDLQELFTLRTHEQALAMSRWMGGVLRRLERLDVPVLMAINAIAVGGGCEVALVGDQRFIASEASLVFRQATLGLICGWGGMTRLERLVGRSKAFHILLREQTLEPDRALALGLVDEVVPRAELMTRVETVAHELIALPPLAVRAVKHGLLRLPELPTDAALDFEAELFARTWASADHWEALAAFQQKRTPKWT